MKKLNMYNGTSPNKRLALRRLTAARVPQNTSRAFSPLWYFAPPHFASPGLCFAKPLFGLAKRRQPRTLCVMPF